jgi:hypothetical protein
MTCNALIVWRLRKRTKKRNKMTPHAFHSDKSSSIAGTLVLINMIFILTLSPILLLYIIKPDFQYLADQKEKSYWRLVFAVIETFSHINHSCNFYLYCLTASSFRKNFVKMVKHSCSCPGQQTEPCRVKYSQWTKHYYYYVLNPPYWERKWHYRCRTLHTNKHCKHYTLN